MRAQRRQIVSIQFLGQVLVLMLILSSLSSQATAADCEMFEAHLQQGEIEAAEDALRQSRTRKACAFHLVKPYLVKGEFEKAVEWINFARLFANRDRDPRLYPLILYYMLLLDPYPREKSGEFEPAFNAELDYDDLLGFGKKRIEQLSQEANIALIPEMRSFLRDPRTRSCPGKSKWVDRLSLDWATADLICVKIEAYAELLQGPNQDIQRAKEKLQELNRMGVLTAWTHFQGPVDSPAPERIADVARTPAPRPASKTATTPTHPQQSPAESKASRRKNPGDAKPRTPTETTSSEPSLQQQAIDLLSFQIIRGRQFRMGCTTGDDLCRNIERPERRVTITRDFRLAAYETTNLAYRKCVEAQVCNRPTRSPDFDHRSKDDHPVVFVNWQQAQDLCQWLGGRLPTEAEWELAARGLIIGSRYPNGDFSREDANSMGTFGEDRWDGTSPVGSFRANGHGLYDMAGNVKEWVADFYGPYKGSRVEDPQGKGKGSLNIMRGGGWDQEEEELRVSARHPAGAIAQKADLGFRCWLPAAGE